MVLFYFHTFGSFGDTLSRRYGSQSFRGVNEFWLGTHVFANEASFETLTVIDVFFFCFPEVISVPCKKIVFMFFNFKNDKIE